jgi:hypothetical protein
VELGVAGRYYEAQYGWMGLGDDDYWQPVRPPAGLPRPSANPAGCNWPAEFPR